MFRKIVKKAQELTIKPLVLWYLKKERHFTYSSLKFTVFPGVFHPLLFNSSLFLAGHMKKLPLKGKSFLEPGSGSGFISVLAAHYGADVTALDLNPLAIKNTLLNAEKNQVELIALESDLFEKIPKKRFDYIFINPPYYPRKPGNDADLAWYCGDNFEYFSALFKQLPDYYDPQSKVCMVLSEDCDLVTIQHIAQSFNQSVDLIATKTMFMEKNFLFNISQKQ